MKYTQLTERERYQLEALMQTCSTQKMIAEALGRNKSTISRELKRNKNPSCCYFSEFAIEKAAERRKRVIPTRFTEKAKNIIKKNLKIGWSPEQISARLKRDHKIKISYELIYKYIDMDRKDGGSLYKYLPHRGKKYKKRNIKTRKVWKSAVKRKLISERPAKVAKKKEIGHWEGDTVVGKDHRGGLGTFVEIKSMYVIIRKVLDKSAEEMKNAILKSFNGCSDIIKTLTVDNGTEFALHDKISEGLGTGVYFATPYSPWERGLNENTNGLIRRFFPKGTDFTRVSEREIIRIQDLLNNRPRKRLNFMTPKEVFIKEIMKIEKYKILERAC